MIFSFFCFCYYQVFGLGVFVGWLGLVYLFDVVGWWLVCGCCVFVVFVYWRGLFLLFICVLVLSWWWAVLV